MLDLTFSTRPPSARELQAYQGWSMGGSFDALINLIYWRAIEHVGRDALYQLDVYDVQTLGGRAVEAMKIGDHLATLSILWEKAGDEHNALVDRTFVEAKAAIEQDLRTPIDLGEVMTGEGLIVPKTSVEESLREKMLAKWARHLKETGDDAKR